MACLDYFTGYVNDCIELLLSTNTYISTYIYLFVCVYFQSSLSDFEISLRILLKILQDSRGIWSF